MHTGGVIFDLDGTLTDSAPGLLASLAHMHETMEWEVPSERELRGWLGPPLATTLQEHGYRADEAACALAAFRTRLRDGGLLESTLYPGVTELLDALHDARIPVALATHKMQVDAERVIDHYGLRSHFAGIHGRLDGEEGHSKAPVIRRALASIGARDAPVWMVGDRNNDIDSAREVGVPSIGVRYGYGRPGELDAAAPTRSASSVAELRALLLG